LACQPQHIGILNSDAGSRNPFPARKLLSIHYRTSALIVRIPSRFKQIAEAEAYEDVFLAVVDPIRGSASAAITFESTHCVSLEIHRLEVVPIQFCLFAWLQNNSLDLIESVTWSLRRSIVELGRDRALSCAGRSLNTRPLKVGLSSAWSCGDRRSGWSRFWRDRATLGPWRCRWF
jgi:hypothetical protein